MLARAIFAPLIAALQRQRGGRMPLAALAFGCGIGGYFALPVEPSIFALLVLTLVGLLAFSLSWSARGTWGPVAGAIGLICAGVVVGGLRTASVAAPALSFRYYGPIEGRIIVIDRSASDKVRLLLDQVLLSRVEPAKTPARVRVSLHGAQDWLTPAPGQRIALTGHLSPPQGPTEPDGFDFQRHAWFQGLGAVGYTRSPAVLLAPPEGGLWVYRLRRAIATAVAAELGGQTGAIAAALTTGDRSGISEQTFEALRASNLAHLLAISGLHMGLLAGFVFAAVRGGLALWPQVALTYPIRKWAALVALPAAAFYLALSGASIATQRAFIMVAVMLIAVLLERRALTLRSVAIAALVILLWRPEALVGPGFQMSFAATTALVVAFRALRGRDPTGRHRWLQPVFAVFVSSLVAGAATAPISAAHFNQVGQYGILANMLSVPLMGLWVMPMVVCAGLLWPLGLSWVPLKAMGWGIDWILGVAHWVASLEGATRAFVAPAPAVLPLLAVGAIWLIAWRGRARWIGVAPIALAFALWSVTIRPAVLIADTGGLVGIMTPQGRAVSKVKGAGFIAGSWLENDGSRMDQPQSAALWSPDIARSYGIVPIAGRGWQEAAAQACHRGVTLVLSRDLDDPPQGCTILSPRRLRDTGALAIDASGNITTARARQGRRPWVPD